MKDVCKIEINFGELEKELDKNDLKLLSSERNLSMYLRDKEEKFYEIEKYFVGSYLDRLQEDGARVRFERVREDEEEIVRGLGLKEMLG